MGQPPPSSDATLPAAAGVLDAAPPAGATARHLHTASVIVAIAGVVIVGALAWVTGVVNSHTQAHLLGVQTRDAALVLGEVVPTVEQPLETAVAVMDAGGSPADVARYLAPEVGTGTNAQHPLFDSFSVWRETAGGAREVLALGRQPALATEPGRLASFFATIDAPRSMAVKGILTGPHPQIAVAEEGVGTSPRYVAYGELPISPSHRATAPTTSAFQNLSDAIYLGKRPTARALLTATTPFPSTGVTGSAVIPFGQSSLLFVDSPTAPLGGGVLPLLPWIIAVTGTMLVVGAVLATEWLARRRRLAERLAQENHRLYSEQRTIAQSLQQALLPQALPTVEGLALAARYVPGDPTADIGGDWYDVIRCGERHLVFTVGDVSGHGIPAANAMASLHFAIRAYAAQGDSAPTILGKLTSLLDIARDGHFATVLLGQLDVSRREATLVSAGHLPPLLVWDGGGERKAMFIETRSGSPIGVSRTDSYDPVTVSLPPRARLLAYTDGLVERCGEHLDVGLERLRQTVIGLDDTGSDTLDEVVRALTGDDARDDIALLELRWTS